MLITLDSFDINSSDIIDLEFLEWYEKNRDKTKQLVKLGYFLLKDGLERYIQVENKQSFSKVFEQEYIAIAVLEAENKMEKKYIDEVRGLREQSMKYKMLLENKQETEEEIRRRIEEVTKIKCEQETVKYKTLYEEIKHEAGSQKERKITELERELAILKKTNFAKGNKGENIILQNLQKHFPLFEYKDCSKEKHSGDIHMIRANSCGEFVMIESKYKEIISKQDVDKFYDDIEHLLKTGRILKGAVFVSILTKNIPHIGEMCVDFFKGIPILFVGFNGEEEFDQWFNQYTLLICELSSYAQKCQVNEKNVDDIIRKINPLMDNVKSLKNSIEKMRNVHLMHMNSIAADIEQGIKKLMESIGELVHNNSEGGFKCNTCAVSFHSKRSLAMHMRVHKS